MTENTHVFLCCSEEKKDSLCKMFSPMKPSFGISGFGRKLSSAVPVSDHFAEGTSSRSVTEGWGVSRENCCVPCTEQSDSPVVEIPLCRALGEVLPRMTQEFTSGLLEQGQALALLCGAPSPCAEGKAHLARAAV